MYKIQFPRLRLARDQFIGLTDGGGIDYAQGYSRPAIEDKNACLAAFDAAGSQLQGEPSIHINVCSQKVR